MIDRKTILGSRVATSFSVNGLWVPANSLTESLVAYIDPALFLTEYEDLESFFISASSFRFTINDRYFAACSSHQLSILEARYDQFAIFTNANGKGETKQRLITSHRAVFDTVGDLDLVVFEFTEPVKAKAMQDVRWWHAKPEELASPVLSALRVFSVGYPGSANRIDYDKNEFKRSPSCVHGEMCEPHMEGCHSFRVTSTSLTDLAGMSGSPVFGIRREDNEPVVFFAGILTNASSSVCNFVVATQVGVAVDAAT
ncbi:MAG: hypothetical protein AAGI10_09950 [Pseudomonadota bacterium]